MRLNDIILRLDEDSIIETSLLQQLIKLEAQYLARISSLEKEVQETRQSVER